VHSSTPFATISRSATAATAIVGSSGMSGEPARVTHATGSKVCAG
jgi:hypothetical protein